MWSQPGTGRPAGAGAGELGGGKQRYEEKADGEREGGGAARRKRMGREKVGEEICDGRWVTTHQKITPASPAAPRGLGLGWAWRGQFPQIRRKTRL